MTWLKRAKKLGRKFQNPVETPMAGLSMMFKVLPLYLASKAERFPKVTPGPFLTDPSLYATPPASGLRVTWFGHSTTLVEIDGVRLLLDPVWDERAAPVQWAGPRRFFPPTIALEDLPPLDAILFSHDHYDHMGVGSVRNLAKFQPTARWIVPLAVGPILERFGVAPGRFTQLDWTESTLVGDVVITALPARHFSGRSAFNRFETLWASYALKGPQHKVYLGGDSGEWPGFQEISQTHGPFDLTLLEIGAFHELWKEIHMGPAGAARSFQAMGAPGMLMPVHWGLFDLALHAWRDPITELTQIAEEQGIPLWSPVPGQPTEVVAGQTLVADWWHPR